MVNIAVTVYLAGYQAATKERVDYLVQSGAIKAQCISFANVVKMTGFPYFVKQIKAGYEACVRHKVNIMMDSGVFSYRQYRALMTGRNDKKAIAKLPSEETFIQTYADFCREFHHLWDFYVTVDLTVHAADNCRRHSALEKLGLRPVPVFHGDGEGSLEYLKRYADKGYKKICIANAVASRTRQRSKRQYYDSVFNEGVKLGLMFHGLGVTTPWLMIEYPWDSVDSSSWSRAAGYGNLIVFNEQTRRIATVHVSDTHSKSGQAYQTDLRIMRRFRQEVESAGYDWKKLQTDGTARHEFNAFTMLQMAEFADKRRGGSWKSWL